MKRIIKLTCLIALTFIISGCGAAKNNQSAVSSVSTSTSTENITVVDIKDFAFTPDFLTIKPGTTVTWTNNDSAPHRIKSQTFTSPQLSQGQSFSFTFNDPGVFTYICSIHTSMGGQIIVQ